MKNNKENGSDYDAYDARIKEMQSRFGGKWQELCLDIVNVPAALAIDDLWKEVILSANPTYGDWEYPGQAYRHLLAEWRGLQAQRNEAFEYLRLLRAEYDRHEHLDDFLMDENLQPLGVTGSAVLHELWRVLKQVVGDNETTLSLRKALAEVQAGDVLPLSELWDDDTEVDTES